MIIKGIGRAEEAGWIHALPDGQASIGSRETVVEFEFAFRVRECFGEINLNSERCMMHDVSVICEM